MAAEDCTYHKTVHRISKKDLFVCLALWMEESPLATGKESGIFESSETSNTVGNKRKTVELDADQYKKKVRVSIEDVADQEPREKETHVSKQESRNDCLKTADQEPREKETHVTKQESRNDCLNTFIIDSNEVSENLIKEEMNEKSKTNKVGVVIVDSNERIVAVDYSREDLHAVANALVVHSEKVRGCMVYVSRKPCSFCTRLMIQMGITKVYYLPLEPEINTPKDLNCCEELYRSCPISQSVYVPTISESVVRDSSLRRSPYTPTKEDHTYFTQVLINQYWTKDWINMLPKVLFWPDFSEVCSKVNLQMNIMFEWLAKVTLVDIPECTRFKPYGLPNGLISGNKNIETHENNYKISTIPNASDLHWQKIARHMSRMAQILSQRSDDPVRGVGAVVLKENEIVAVGWNGFPSKALYGDFPRANDSDVNIKDKKYPYIIHAEQSTILSRFIQDINHSTTTMFVSKMPCNECIPVIVKVGIKNVLFPPERKKEYVAYLKTDLIMKQIAAGKVKGYISEVCPKNEAK